MSDPRIKLLPRQRLEEAANKLITILLEQVQETQSENSRAIQSLKNQSQTVNEPAN